MKRGRAATIWAEVSTAVRRWPEFAAQAGVADVWRAQIQRSLRLEWAGEVGRRREAVATTMPAVATAMPAAATIPAAATGVASVVVVAHELN